MPIGLCILFPAPQADLPEPAYIKPPPPPPPHAGTVAPTTEKKKAAVCLPSTQNVNLASQAPVQPDVGDGGRV